MEMETGAPISRKRKLAPATESAEAPDPTPPPPSAHSPPPGVGEDGGGADRISNLPDAILGEIISLLPTKDGARTQILESRWRHVWRSAPLNLNCNELPTDTDVRAGIVSRILSAHLCPGRRFCLQSNSVEHAATVKSWLQSPVLDNLEELEFGYPMFLRQLEKPPASIFRFSPTLRAATIRGCDIPHGIRSCHFPKLKQLALEMVHITECSLHSMIASCPALVCLLIASNGFRRLRINSRTLRSICVRARCYMYRPVLLEELIIENAPCLERLILLDRCEGLHVSVISAPKLETLGCLSSNIYPETKLFFGSTVIQGVRVHSLTTVVCNVKILALSMLPLCLDTVIKLMKCFPCLEKLYIQRFGSGPNNFWRRKHKNLTRCLDIGLKTIVMEPYQGTKSDVNFATFFILNARILESMTLGVSENSEEFIAEQHRKLQLENRASRGAQFHFSIYSDRDVSDIKHVRDFNLTDPFVY